MPLSEAMHSPVLAANLGLTTRVFCLRSLGSMPLEAKSAGLSARDTAPHRGERVLLDV